MLTSRLSSALYTLNLYDNLLTRRQIYLQVNMLIDCYRVSRPNIMNSYFPLAYKILEDTSLMELLKYTKVLLSSQWISAEYAMTRVGLWRF